MLRLNKAKRAARLRAAALRGRVARKPAPTTPRRAAPATPRRRPLPGPASTPCRPPPSALRAQSCLGSIKTVYAASAVPLGTATYLCKLYSSVSPITIIYAQRLVAALVIEDKQAMF
ncbi:uncharacterized protein BDR25DRAFT_309751 [Lindgomyces ingoldianus]|uniref:Uncharacterized protein n=1 Tax=Lindgomyces ingoldianus TaxID=673940 RepID=A0ACB6RAX9_9PLEO|nr:uncharacterized protein BDR25DRAFT_309751 [Lindgomyces ingoldianus]KAF2476341.1 hypothetical protein BDR25DRAFT_309751 [Lindgomyces ingoldianus]